MECSKRDTCVNRDIKCYECHAMSDMYNIHPCYTDEKWISVKKDGFPKKNGRYLCLIDSKFYMILSFAEKLKAVDKYDFKNVNRPGFYEYDNEYGHYEIDNITHWMSLPELPLKPA